MKLNSMEIQGWNGNNSIFRNMVKEYQPEVIIEVGTWHGQSAINMAKTVKEFGLNTKIYCVDTWLGALEFMNTKDKLSSPVDSSRDLLKKDGYPSVYYTFLQNVIDSDVQDVIIPVPQTSQIAALWFKREGIKADIVYIDAGHDYKSVIDDVSAYLPLTNKVIFGDDYLNKDYEVTEAVNYLFDGNIEVVDKNFWIKKI